MDRSLNGDDFRLLARWQDEIRLTRMRANRHERIEVPEPVQAPIGFRKPAVLDAQAQRCRAAGAA